MKKLFILLVVFASIIACNDSQLDGQLEDIEMSMEEESEIVPVASSNGLFSASVSSAVANRKIIWNGNMEFQVDNVNVSTAKITELINQSGGFISRVNLQSNKHEISNDIQIRIDQSKFDHIMENLKGESIYLKRIQVNSKDVTEEFIDIESRLKTKRDVRDRYITILNTKTGDVKDIIQAEEAIRKITEEIEAKEGRLRYLKDQVKLSTINLRIYQEVEFTQEPTVYVKTFTEKAANALGNGWRIVTWFVLFVLTTWPFWLIIILLGIWKRKWFKAKFEN